MVTKEYCLELYEKCDKKQHTRAFLKIKKFAMIDTFNKDARENNIPLS